jgi:hydrogenase expression/formation protein HypC
MCLAIPGKVVDWIDGESPLAMAIVEFEGVRRPISLACVPETEIGEYVLAHAGIAISRIDAEEAQRVFQALAELEAAGELDVPDGC